jgi:hypothetical protein
MCECLISNRAGTLAPSLLFLLILLLPKIP